jgi:UDP-glucose 4-epimerase
MRILCTGGAGYVGSACLRRLLEHGHEAIAFDDLSSGNRAAVPDGRLIVGDVLDRAALMAAMRRHQTEAVMHFAALTSVPESINDPESYWRVNVFGTKSVLDAMIECGVKRIIFSSTAAVYAFTDEMPLTEQSPLSPQTPYGTTKLTAERLIEDYARAYELSYVHLRYFNAAGADIDGTHGEARPAESHLIPLTLSVANGRRDVLRIYGNDYDTRDGTCVRDYVHIDDLAQAHRLAVEAIEPGAGCAYNLGSGTGTTVLEAMRACEEVVGRPIAHEFVPRRVGDPATLIASPARIERELGWQPRFADIHRIVETAWRWHDSHPDGYETLAASERTT